MKSYDLLIRDISNANNVPKETLTKLPMCTIVNIYNNLFGLKGNYQPNLMTLSFILDDVHNANHIPLISLNLLPDSTVVNIFNNLFGIKDNPMTPQEMSRVSFPKLKPKYDNIEKYTENLTVDDLLDLLNIAKITNDIEYINDIKNRLADLTRSGEKNE